jgi:hypothetical protein
MKSIKDFLLVMIKIDWGKYLRLQAMMEGEVEAPLIFHLANQPNVQSGHPS